MQVLGWTPAGEYGEVDVQTTFQTPVENWHGQMEPCFDNPNSVLGVNVSTTPTSLPSTSSSTSSFYKATSPQRRRDPKHIPRPRNSFIIFRCDYTRQHCLGGDCVSSQAEKRCLSKRAGEAWKNVSPETRKYYKKLADVEKDEHAKRNPEYRFQPRRRRSSVKTVQAGTKERVDHMSSSQTKNSRSRSSSFSSVGSCADKTVKTIPPSFSQSSGYPTPSPSVQNLSWSQPSSPETSLSYPSPGSPYTPADSPSEKSSYFSNGFEQDHMLSYLAINDFSLGFNDSEFFDMLYGNISQNASPDCSLPIKESQQYPETMGTHPPLAIVASSLDGWNGECDASGTQISSYNMPLPSSQDMFGYKPHRGIPEHPSFDEYVLGLPPPTTTSFNKDHKNNLDAYSLGLNDYGIGSNMSRSYFSRSAPRL